MATRSPRRGASRSAGERRRRRPKTPAPSDVEEIAERAARLGITVDRVLWEYAAIAFADLRHIVEEEPEGGFRIRPLSKMSDADVAAISEIVPGKEAGRSRVKLYDRKAALDAIARHLGMFPPPRRQQAAPSDDQEEDPREFLARELARLAAGAAAAQPDLGSEPRACAEDQA